MLLPSSDQLTTFPSGIFTSMNTETCGFFQRNSVITPFSTMGLCSRSYEIPVPWCANNAPALKNKETIKMQNVDDLPITVPPHEKVIQGFANLVASIATLG